MSDDGVDTLPVDARGSDAKFAVDDLHLYGVAVGNLELTSDIGGNLQTSAANEFGTVHHF